MTLFAETLTTVEQTQPMALSGVVAHVRGLTLRVTDVSLPIGAMVEVRAQGRAIAGEVVGFDDDETIVMLLGETEGIRRGDRVTATEVRPTARVGEALLGRVVDGMGRPIDGGGALRETVSRPLRPKTLDPLRRVPIDAALGSGVRAIDAMLTLGRGQRMGVFSGAGIGKSTLLGMMARQTSAAVSVVALIGERGREVRDFIERCLGEQGLQRSVVIAATADEPALMRVRAALYATAVAEWFRDAGLDVLFVMDSVTRFAQAQRQIGLAAGEPLATKGFTPSVFASLPTLLERTGRTDAGSITALYAILVEGDDLTEPISDACRGILDGHVVLSRALADREHWPAIDVPGSISRVAPDVIDAAHESARQQIGRLISAYRDVEDLVNIGAYAPGSNATYDLAIEMKPAIDRLLQQGAREAVSFDAAKRQLLELAAASHQTAQRLAAQRQPGRGAGATAGAR